MADKEVMNKDTERFAKIASALKQVIEEHKKPKSEPEPEVEKKAEEKVEEKQAEEPETATIAFANLLKLAIDHPEKMQAFRQKIAEGAKVTVDGPNVRLELGSFPVKTASDEARYTLAEAFEIIGKAAEQLEAGLKEAEAEHEAAVQKAAKVLQVALAMQKDKE